MKKWSPTSPEWFPEESWELHQSAANLTQYACIVSSRHIRDVRVRGRFNRTMAYYVRQVLEDVRSAKISTEQGLQILETNHKGLSQIALEFTKKGGGLIAGIFQVAAGGALCATKVGCVVGLPLMLHGGNNVYENGANLWTGRSDAQGLVRKVYQKGAILLGGTASHGNIAYGVGDIAFSLHGIYRKVVSPSAFKLFTYIESDYVRAYTVMKGRALWFEVFANLLVLEQMYLETQSE